MRGARGVRTSHAIRRWIKRTSSVYQPSRIVPSTTVSDAPPIQILPAASS
jgi:hypothetical protein